MEKTMISGQEFLYGYVDGNRYMVSNTVKQICSFIMKYRFKNVKIVNMFDVLEIETSMGFITYCQNQVFLREQLIPELAPMQMGEADVPEFAPYVKEAEYVVSNVRMKTNAGHFIAIASFEEGFIDIYDRQSGYFQTEDDVLVAYPTSINMSEAEDIAIEKGWLTRMICYKAELNDNVECTEEEFRKEVKGMIDYNVNEKEYDFKNVDANRIAEDITGIFGNHEMPKICMDIITEELEAFGKTIKE